MMINGNEEIDKLKIREETAKKILQSDAYYKDIYKALCNLFEVDEEKYKIDNSELKEILEEGGFCV